MTMNTLMATLLLLLLTANVLSFQQVHHLQPRDRCLAKKSVSPFLSSRSTADSTSRYVSLSPLLHRKVVGPTTRTGTSTLSLSSIDVDFGNIDGGLAKANKVAIWATIAAGANLAYYLYNNIGGKRATWIGVGVMTQVAGFLVRTLQGKLKSNIGTNAWLRNLVVFQSVGLSLFSHGVFYTQWTKALMGLSGVVGLWAFMRDKSSDDGVSYPLLTSLRVNEVTQIVAAKQLFVPVLTNNWPAALNNFPVSIGAYALAILPSILQCVGTIAEGDYAEQGNNEGKRLTGYICFLVSWLLLTAYTRGLSVGVTGGALVAAAGKARSAGRGLAGSTARKATGKKAATAGRGWFGKGTGKKAASASAAGAGLAASTARKAGKTAASSAGRGIATAGRATGKKAASSGLRLFGIKLPFDFVVKLEANFK